MTHQTASEALEKYKKIMGAELGVIFHHLLQDTYYVSSIWDQYETLFERTERIDLLNESAGYFFGNVQRIFFDYTLLGICRLTDPAKISSRQNLSIRQLPKLVKPEIKSDLEELIDHASSASQFCRNWRNRKIAHNDLDHKLEVGEPLEAATRLGATRALVAIHDVLRLPAAAYCNTDLGFVDVDDSASHMLFQLYRGREQKQTVRERLENREYRKTDVEFPEWLNQPGRFDRYGKR